MKKNKKNKPYVEMSIWTLLKLLLISRLPKKKEKIAEGPIPVSNPQPEGEINHLAIVLDGIVEDVMRCQNRLAALLLSQPQFVEFDPSKDRPQIGETKYVDGKFEYPIEPPLLTDEEIEQIVEKLDKEDED